MIRICVVLIVLLIALMIGAMIFDDQGYVFVEFSGWVVEMNVFSLAMCLIFIFVGFMLVNWLIKTSLKAASGSRNWLGNWGYRKKQKAFRQGLIALAETNYLAAKDQLAKVENEDFDGINLLAAADVEIQLGNPEQAKAYWKMATTFDKSTLAANICLIRSALQEQSPDQALSLIQALTDKQKQQTPVIKLWAEALGQANQWQNLKAKLKGWKKALGSDYQTWVQQASKGSFAEIASKQGAAELKQNWQAQPRATRKDPGQQAAYIQQLIDQGMFTDAEKVLVEYQKSGPNPLLVPLFKQIKLPNPVNAIRQLETWIKQDEHNVDLLSALAHIAHYSGDKVLAEKVLSKAIKLANRQQDLRLMAEIKEADHDDSHALQFYKQSIAQQDK
ncbi:heme biosynthesis HemY N-terminal domain-containing protein [Paraglaciecola sp.]|uniref:heme biosynthesis HemY N-terminal domain-containing protein n=1 Tax=Paraglaciecola sp. TaxID=1920173 RepID=UPI003EF5DB1A